MKLTWDTFSLTARLHSDLDFRSVALHLASKRRVGSKFPSSIRNSTEKLNKKRNKLPMDLGNFNNFLTMKNHSEWKTTSSELSSKKKDKLHKKLSP